MLEPLIALSVASNVLQLVQPTSQLSIRVYEVWNQGSPASIRQLTTITRRAIDQAEHIRAQLAPSVPSAAELVALPVHDQKLLSLAVEYKNAGSELLQFLGKLFPHAHGKPSFLQSVERTARASFKRETLDHLLERMITLQSALNLELVTALRVDINEHRSRTNGQFESINTDLQIIIQQLERSLSGDEQRLREVISSCLSQQLSNYHVPQPITVRSSEHDRPSRDTQKEKSMLRMLYFRQIQDRHQEIAEACSRTFEWIFRAPSEHRPWSSFVSFLEQDQTLPYWINEWIPEAFPLLWQNWKVTDADEPPSLIEVRKGFEKLLSKGVVKLCILIDGIDEFDVDRNELASYVKGLCSPMTKVILSSRPIPDSVAAFEMCPQLRVQDLTVDDIRIFVKEHLVEHVQVKDLLRAHPTEAIELVTELQRMADGVFLWVHLVIKLLVEGIQKEEQISDLQRRLRAMPPTLELLYMRMMDNMDPIHQVRAAETFQIVESWNAKEMKAPLTALLLSAIEFRDTLAKGPLTLTEVTNRCKKVEAFIRNRCCGLLEVHRTYETPEHSRTMHAGLIENFTKIKPNDITITDSSIQYLHRTVAEFLHTDAIWSKICSLTPESFDPESRLADACYFIIRHQPRTNRATGAVWNWVNNYAVFARGINKANDNLYLEQMRQFDAVMTEFYQATQSNSSLHWSSHWPLATAKKFDDATLENRLLTGHSFTTFAVRMGFNRLLKLQLSAHNWDIPYEIYALDSWFNRNFVPPQNARAETLKLLLRRGRANIKIGEHTSWQLAIHLVDTTINSGFALDACKLLEIYILAGAAVNDSYGKRSALHVANSLRHYRGGNEVSKILDQEKGSGSEYIVFDESQIHQYAQKLEVLLRERGAVGHCVPPTSSPNARLVSPLIPAIQPLQPLSQLVQPNRREWENNLENSFRQMSIIPPQAQPCPSTPSYPVLSHRYYSSHLGQRPFPNEYLVQTHRHMNMPPPQAPNLHGQTHPYRSFSHSMYYPPSGQTSAPYWYPGIWQH